MDWATARYDYTQSLDYCFSLDPPIISADSWATFQRLFSNMRGCYAFHMRFLSNFACISLFC